jgi:hypothetical protein
MKHMKLFILLLVLVGSVLLVVYPVLAHCGKCAEDGKKIVALMDQGKVTLAKTIEAAEKHSKGRALSVISELNKDGKLAQEVYCIVGDKIMKCSVDGGSVADMKEVKEFPVTESEGHSHSHADDVHSSPKMIKSQTAEAGCGSCIYSMAGVKGCQLAVKIDGKAYLVTGADHVDAHKLCGAAKKAVVSGTIEGDKFVATSFEFQP